MRLKGRYGLLLVLAAMLLIAACSSNTDGNQANPTPDGPNSGGANATNGEAAAEEPAEPTEKPRITSTVYDRGSVPASEGTLEDNRWTRWIQENGPVDVQFVSIPRWESQQSLNVMFASQDAPDLILEYDTAYRNQLYSQQLLQPLDELIAAHSPNYQAMLEAYPALGTAGVKDDGQIYEIARMNGLTTNHIMWIRKDWLDALELKVPETVEELFEVAVAFTEQDPDRNGQDDTFGIALSYISGMTVDFMFGNVFTRFDKQPWYPDENDELVHDWDRKQAAVAFKKRLFDAGVVDRDFLTDNNGDKAKQDFVSGKLGIWGSGMDFGAYEALLENFPDANPIPIALPESEFGRFSPVLANPVQSVAVINVLAEDPKAVMKHIDFMLEPDTKKMFRFGEEGRHHEVKDGCPVLIDDPALAEERSYIADFSMLFSIDADNPCEGWWNYNENNATPAQLAFRELRYDAMELYVNKERPIPAITHSEHMPQLPEDLFINQQNGFTAVYDILTRVIVNGAGGNVEQAITEAKTAWTRANGEAIDEWYATWYRENKETAFLRDDMYSLAMDIHFRK